jgi:hypothetical protein
MITGASHGNCPSWIAMNNSGLDTGISTEANMGQSLRAEKGPVTTDFVGGADGI